MHLLSNLFGRSRAGPIPLAESLTDLARAAPLLEGELETQPTGEAGLIIQPDLPYNNPGLATVVSELLRAGAGTARLPWRVQEDDHQHAWIIISAADLAALVDSCHSTVEALRAAGTDRLLLALVFPFSWQDKRMYWMLRPRSGRFSPFVPIGSPSDRQRDFALEVRMEHALRKVIPTARDAKEWYPLWGIPI